ncbi:hypothetical protein WSS_A32595 [Rhodococcus opacus M213]|uniref:Uncharacterized protein n=1 Tax=Rhodococcus opacus M213 TaxID=1129896 RepID=K8XJK3_RHOOP|nr:hypothetical protein WSS_A32595 [Rhodococcus opacus M213]
MDWDTSVTAFADPTCGRPMFRDGWRGHAGSMTTEHGNTHHSESGSEGDCPLPSLRSGGLLDDME